MPEDLTVTLRRFTSYRTRPRGRRLGFALVAFSLGLLLILGCAGLIFDIGRMYITRSESQTFCDAAAIAAVQQLNGANTGITSAKSAAWAIPKRYQFGTTAFQQNQVSVTFAKDPPTSWDSNPASGAGYVYARVTTSVPLPMMLMPVITRQFNATIGALATAKQVAVNNAMDHIFPFAPLWVPPGGSVDPPGSDPYGMKTGDQYTLRGASNTKSLSDMCNGDKTVTAEGFRQNMDQSDRGYIWNTKSANDIKQQILSESVPTGHTMSIGDEVLPGAPNADCTLYPCLVPGDKQSEVSAIQTRAGGGNGTGDTNSTSQTYAQYEQSGTGNGDRVVVTAIVTGPCGPSYAGAPACPNYPPVPYAPPDLAGTTAAPYSVLGFAGFFLLTPNSYNSVKGNDPICAEYIGPWVPDAAGGSPFPGGYKLLLVE